MMMIGKEIETDIEELKKQLAEVNSLIQQQDIVVATTKSDDVVTASRERTKLRDLENKASAIRARLNKQLMVKQSATLMNRFDEIAEKNNCMRVRFYDWLAGKLEQLALSLRNRATKISTPCVVKLPSKNENKDPSWFDQYPTVKAVLGKKK